MTKQYRTSKLVLAGAFIACLLAAPSSEAISYSVETPYGLGSGMHWDEYQWEYKPGAGFTRTEFSFGNRAYLPTPFGVFADDGSVGRPVTVEFVIELSGSRTSPVWFLPPLEESANFGGFGSVEMQAVFNASVGIDISSRISETSFGRNGIKNQVGDSLGNTLVTWTLPLEVGTQYSLEVVPEDVEFAVNDLMVTDPTHRAAGLLSGRAEAKVVDIRVVSVPEGGTTYALLLIAVLALFAFRWKHERCA